MFKKTLLGAIVFVTLFSSIHAVASSQPLTNLAKNNINRFIDQVATFAPSGKVVSRTQHRHFYNLLVKLWQNDPTQFSAFRINEALIMKGDPVIIMAFRNMNKTAPSAVRKLSITLHSCQNSPSDCRNATTR